MGFFQKERASGFNGFNGFLSNLSLHFDSSESYDKIRIMYATNDGDW